MPPIAAQARLFKPRAEAAEAAVKMLEARLDRLISEDEARGYRRGQEDEK